VTLSEVGEALPITLPTIRVRPFDPAPELAELRERAPAVRLRFPDGHVGWLVTSYSLGRAILADSRFSTRPRRAPVGDPVKWAAVHDARDADPAARSGDLLFLEPHEHTRLRQMLTGHFTVSRVNEHRSRIEQIVVGRLEAMRDEGPPADLFASFAMPVSSATHCALLGVPPSDGVRFVRPGAVMIDPDASAEEKLEAWAEFREFAQTVVTGKRLAPADDLISDLVGRGELSDDEIIGLSISLFSAGVDVTAGMLALGGLLLLSHPEALAELRADPALIEPAVEELLRYLTIFQLGAFPRTALEDVELEGVAIAAGESVMVSVSAANRDPHKFEDPDRLDLMRTVKGHLAFGFGRHMCLGQHLARAEMQIGLSRLIEQFPTLRLAVPLAQIPLYGGNHIAYGVRELPVEWDEQ
jgi:cytochrome P450